ncbi:hypothetical protein OKW44_001214 [Paraburkholderia sp. WSM4174]
MEATTNNSVARVPWNKDKLTGQKPPAEAQGNLGHPDQAAARGENP